MNSKLLQEGNERTFVIVFDDGEDPAQGLLKFAQDEKITSARFTAIGAFQNVTLGWFNIETKDYEKNVVQEQVEVVSLVGNVASFEGKPKVHAHVVVAKRDAVALGGHLMKAAVRPTLEVMLTETPRHLRRTTDAATGLALIDVEATTQPHRRGRDVALETT